MLAHDEGAVSLILTQALRAPGTVVALGAELKAIIHFAGSRFFQAAALGADFSGGTNGSAFLHLNLKVFYREPTVSLRRRLRRTDEFPTLGLRLHQQGRRDVRPIHILHRRLFPPPVSY